MEWPRNGWVIVAPGVVMEIVTWNRVVYPLIMISVSVLVVTIVQQRLLRVSSCLIVVFLVLRDGLNSLVHLHGSNQTIRVSVRCAKIRIFYLFFVESFTLTVHKIEVVVVQYLVTVD